MTENSEKLSKLISKRLKNFTKKNLKLSLLKKQENLLDPILNLKQIIFIKNQKLCLYQTIQV